MTAILPSVSQTDYGVRIDAGQAIFNLSVCNEHILKIRLGNPERNTASSYLPDRDWPPARLSLEPGRPAKIHYGKIVLQFHADEIRLDFCNPGAQVLLQLYLPLMRNGDRPGIRISCKTLGEQHFYGLGHTGPGFDRLGMSRRFWNCHINHGHGADIAVPLLLSNRGYALFFDSSRCAWLDPGNSYDANCFDYSTDDETIDLYYLYADDMRSSLAETAVLLGRAPIPPQWSLGYLQSTRHFENWAELRRLANRFRQRQLPCDALILLSSYGKSRGWNQGVGQLDFHAEILSEPGKNIGELHALGFRVLTHEYPVLAAESPLHAEALAKDYLLQGEYPDDPGANQTAPGYHEGQRFLDFSRTEAGAWWWRQHAGLLAAGVDGWWLDGGEGPQVDTPAGMDKDNGLHNRFDLYRQQAFAKGEARDRPQQRAFLLTRSGGPGMQGFGAACWSGDSNSSFASLEAQIALGLNMGLSGIPYWGSDIGGYYPSGPADAELFVRWFQFGAFCPVFRAHGRNWRQALPWAHGEEAEKICRQYLELRYQLLPYTYTLAWQAHGTGLPLMRALVLNYPDDPGTWNMGSEYLWGDDILVTPVTRAGASHWPVYLPPGVWYDFWTDTAYTGATNITVATPLHRMPLFIRAGAIIPLGPVKQHQDERSAAPELISWLVYPQGNNTFVLYEDDGISNVYQKGHYALTEFNCAVDQNELRCTIEPTGKWQKLLPAQRTHIIRIKLPQAPRAVHLEGHGAGSLPQTQSDNIADRWHYAEGLLTLSVKKHSIRVKIIS